MASKADQWTQWTVDDETSQDIAETRKLVELAAQRCIELKNAVELAKADGSGASEGAQAMVARAMAESPQIRPVTIIRGPTPSVSRFSSAQRTAVSPVVMSPPVSPAPYMWSGVATSIPQVVPVTYPAVPVTYPAAPAVVSPYRTQVMTACRSSPPTAFRTLQVSRPGSLLVSQAPSDPERSWATSSSCRIETGMTGGNAKISKKLPSINFSLAGKKCASGRPHLYEAPFSPSLCYKDGEEFFRIPAGWAAMRTKAGLLLWFELTEDQTLSEAVKNLAQAPQGTSAGGRQSSPQRSISLKDGESGRRRTTSTRLAAPFALTLQLPASSSTATSNATRQAPTAASPTTLVARARGSCSIDGPVRLPIDDVMVLHPTGGGGVGIRAALSLAEGAGAKGGVDGALKVWISSLGKGSYEC